MEHSSVANLKSTTDWNVHLSSSGIIILKYENKSKNQCSSDDVFTYDPPHSYIILLVDELDVLLTSLQNEIYCLLEWVGLPKSNFIIICIANLMDLDQRLKPKIVSRFGNIAIKFYSYKASELGDIINSRVGDLKVFDKPAIEYCSKSFANFGGDTRKALEACKCAIDLILIDKLNEKKDDDDGKKKIKTTVSLNDMVQTIRELQSTRALTLISKLSENQQVFLTALLMDMRPTNCSMVPMKDICRRHRWLLLLIN